MSTGDGQRWPRYGVLAAVYAAELRRLRPGVPVVAGRGRVHPTWCDALVEARGTADVIAMIPVAVRRGRAAARVSQRAAALCWRLTLSTIIRAEKDPAQLKLGAVLDVLHAAGYDLQVVGPGGALTGAELRPDEALARTADGRRLRAHAPTARLTREPRWLAETGQTFLERGPHWTSEPAPGRYPA